MRHFSNTVIQFNVYTSKDDYIILMIDKNNNEIIFLSMTDNHTDWTKYDSFQDMLNMFTITDDTSWDERIEITLMRII